MFNRAAFVRAVRGPVLMIALGVLFVLDQSGVVRVSATWPFLMILIGLFKLAERLLGPAVNAAPAANPVANPVSGANPWTGAAGGNTGGMQR